MTGDEWLCLWCGIVIGVGLVCACDVLAGGPQPPSRVPKAQRDAASPSWSTLHDLNERIAALEARATAKPARKQKATR